MEKNPPTPTEKTKIFIEKARKIHGDKYDYTLSDYQASNKPLTIICPEHGPFQQRPNHHLEGHGCLACAGRQKHTNQTFEATARKVHGDLYGYEKVNYINAHTPVEIYCKACKEYFWQSPTTHLSGCGCPKCSKKRTAKKLALTKEEFIEKANKVHNDKFDYSHITYVNNITPIELTCPDCGKIFTITPASHLRGHGCLACSHRRRAEAQRDTLEDFLKKAYLIHGDKYDYSQAHYINAATKMTIICRNCGKPFQQTPNHHLSGSGCPSCAMQNSKGEEELVGFLKGLGLDLQRHNRKILNGMELDIFIPNKLVAVEYNGLYWHSEISKDRNYHLKKTEECEKQGIRLIHIFEDEWLFQRSIVESRLKHILGIGCDEKVFARKCNTKEIDFHLCKEFLSQNHIQGSCVASVCYGLYDGNDELVAVMSFGYPRMRRDEDLDNVWELLRYCCKNGLSVIGGGGKLLHHFIKLHNPRKIISYADRRWSDGNLYKKLGFDFIHNSEPNYFYIVGNRRESRFKFRKENLIKEGYDANKSEHSIMLEDKGIYRIYDSGNMVFEMNILK